MDDANQRTTPGNAAWRKRVVASGGAG